MQRFFFTGTDWKNTISIARHRDRTVNDQKQKLIKSLKRILRFTCAFPRSFRTKYEFDTDRASSSRFLLSSEPCTFRSVEILVVVFTLPSTRAQISIRVSSMQNYWFHVYGTIMDRDEARGRRHRKTIVTYSM